MSKLHTINKEDQEISTLTSNYKSIKQALINSAWDARLSIDNLSKALSPHLEKHKSKPYSKILIFSSSSSLADNSKLDIVLNLAAQIASANIQPIFLLAKDLDSNKTINTPSLNKLYETCLKNSWLVYNE